MGDRASRALLAASQGLQNTSNVFMSIAKTDAAKKNALLEAQIAREKMALRRDELEVNKGYMQAQKDSVVFKNYLTGVDRALSLNTNKARKIALDRLNNGAYGKAALASGYQVDSEMALADIDAAKQANALILGRINKLSQNDDLSKIVEDKDLMGKVSHLLGAGGANFVHNYVKSLTDLKTKAFTYKANKRAFDRGERGAAEFEARTGIPAATADIGQKVGVPVTEDKRGNLGLAAKLSQVNDIATLLAKGFKKATSKQINKGTAVSLNVRDEVTGQPKQMFFIPPIKGGVKAAQKLISDYVKLRSFDDTLGAMGMAMKKLEDSKDWKKYLLGPVGGWGLRLLNKLGLAPVEGKSVLQLISESLLAKLKASQGSRPSDLDLLFVGNFVMPKVTDLKSTRWGVLNNLKFSAKLQMAYLKAAQDGNPDAQINHRNLAYSISHEYGKQYDEFIMSRIKAAEESKNPAAIAEVETYRRKYGVKEVRDIFSQDTRGSLYLDEATQPQDQTQTQTQAPVSKETEKEVDNLLNDIGF